MRSLHLTGAPNARDLGGLRAADGRVIQSGRLIRSGALWRLTPEDIKTLQSIPLRTVVDFLLCAEKPNLDVPGAELIYCPILPQLTGVTRELGADGVPAYFRLAMDTGMDAERWMAGLYLPLVESAYSREHYREFLHLVLEQKSGALLYHCTAGKDRVGVATLLILSALGVPPKTIMEDYLLTNKYTAAECDAVCGEARQYSADPALQFALQAFESVREAYLNNALQSISEHYGTVDNYLAEALEFGPAECAALRENYLVSFENGV